MATKSVQSNSYDGRYLKLTVTEESTSIETNTSTVRWTLESIGGSDTYYTIYNCSAVVNGQTVANYGTKYWDSYQFPAKKGSVTGTVTVPHNNDGTASPMSFTLNGKVYNSGTESHSDTLDLTTIPRYATVTQTLKSKTETTITMNWTADNNCDYLWYSTDKGINWVEIGSINATNGTYTITGLTPNTLYNVRTKVRRKDSQLTSGSPFTAITTYDYPYAKVMPNFIIESGEDLTLTLENPLNKTVSIEGIGANNTTIFTGSSSSGTATITMTSANTLAQYSSIPNTASAVYQVKVTESVTSTVRTKTGGTYSTDSSKCSPLFSNFSYWDDNTVTETLTGNNKVNVNGYTTAYVLINQENKAVAQKGATMSKYLFSVGNGPQIEIPYLNLETNGYIENSPSGVYNVWAVDSRGNSTLVTKNAETEIPYMQIAKDQITIERQNNVNEEVTLKFNGTFWDGDFGAVNNSLTGTYKYKRTSSDTWTPGSTNITNLITTSNGTYSFEDEILGDTSDGFDIAYSYDIEVTISDELSSIKFATTLVAGIPNLAIDKKGVAINGQYNENLNDGLQVNGKIYLNGNELIVPTVDSSVSTTSTNTVQNQAITNYVDGKISNSSGSSTTTGYSQSYLNTYVEDTGWVDMSSYVNTSNFTIRGDSTQYKPMVRRIGKVVYWKGSIYCSTALNQEQGTLLRNVPQQFMPNREVAGAGNHYNLNRIFSIWTEGRDIKVNEGYNIQTTNFWQGYSLSCLGPYTID